MPGILTFLPPARRARAFGEILDAGRLRRHCAARAPDLGHRAGQGARRQSWPLFAPLAGAMGAFVAGSDTISNVVPPRPRSASSRPGVLAAMAMNRGRRVGAAASAR
jgi:hypothetical protein